MSNKVKFFGLGIIILGFLLSVIGLRLTNSGVKPKPVVQEPKVATDSAFAKAIEEARKKEDEERRKKEKEEKFIAAYGPCRWIPILMYHHIDGSKNWLYVDTNIFAGQMDYLVGKGYTAVSLPEVVAGLASGQLPSKPVVITFDDGYRDVFTNAYPILRQRNLKATVFVITQLVEGADYLTWEQIREMAANPLITIGDHTLSHRGLGGLSEQQIKDEIISSKNILESQLKTTVNVFSYPYGSYKQTAVKYLQEAKFVAAVTTEYGVSCARAPYNLRRIRIGKSALSNYGL